jgi:DNA repair exonuclease SbcCD ATPase subunit
MRKKQLLAVNSNLFSEIEKLNVEIKTLKIKLEEKTTDADRLGEENAQLKEMINGLNASLEEATEKISALENMPSQKEIVYIEKSVDETKEPKAEEHVSSQTNIDIETVIKDIEVASATTIKTEAAPIEITKDQRAKLTEKGASAIGKITKLTALVTGMAEENPDINYDEIYSMALGKNEAFKTKVAALVASKEDFETILKNLDELTNVFEKDIKDLLN